MTDDRTPDTGASTDAFTPAEEFIIQDLETLKVLADPLRISILESLQQPGTVKEVAEMIDRPPTKLYYHFNLLEKHHLIRMVDTRIVSGIVEKHYQVAARRYRLAWGLLSPSDKEFDERLEVTLSGVFGAARQDLRDSLVRGAVETAQDVPPHHRLMLSQAASSLTPERAEEFYSKLRTLLSEYGFTDREIDTRAPGKRLYKLLLLLHPSSRGGPQSGD
ncbi:MAG: ArsR/SmtB family transcription factor [Chloroflexota bacterium]